MNDKITTQDRRVKKTKYSIKTALIDLLSQKNISQITVKELADKADINRNTFYGHYDTVYDVITEIENDIINDLNDRINGNEYIDTEYNPFVIFNKLTSLINENYKFYSLLNKSISTLNLINRIKNILRDKLLEELNLRINNCKSNLNLVVEFACSGTFAVYQEWLNSSDTISMENISQELSKLSLACMNCLESEINT